MSREIETEYSKLRNLTLIKFKDDNGDLASIQESSSALEDCLWLGLDEVKPIIMAQHTPEGGNGWRDVSLPEEAHVFARMHLTRQHAAFLIPLLKEFVKTGHLPDENTFKKSKRK